MCNPAVVIWWVHPAIAEIWTFHVFWSCCEVILNASSDPWGDVRITSTLISELFDLSPFLVTLHTAHGAVHFVHSASAKSCSPRHFSELLSSRLFSRRGYKKSLNKAPTAEGCRSITLFQRRTSIYLSQLEGSERVSSLFVKDAMNPWDLGTRSRRTDCSRGKSVGIFLVKGT